jgi:RNase P/RNase MRP subunit p29
MINLEVNEMSGNISELNFIQHELIGLQAKIIESRCLSLQNLSGTIVNETMNTFEIEYSKNRKKKTIMVPKHNIKYKFKIPIQKSGSQNKGAKKFQSIEIDGAVLTKRPEDRIKKLAKIVQKLKKKMK